MFYDWVCSGLKRGIVTTAYPYRDDSVDNYRGRPAIGPGTCPEGCDICRQVCLAGAIHPQDGSVVIDAGRCFFCGRCESACPDGRITFTNCFEMAAASREGLLVSLAAAGPGSAPTRPPFGQAPGVGTWARRAAVPRPERDILHRSLHIRHVDAGSCGACVRETAALTNPFYDASRLGIFLVTSPRHADVLLVNGPVSQGMVDPLREAYEAMPGPKFVIAAGSCAIGGGPFGQPQTLGGVDAILPVDVYIPGCPPHPLALLDGLRLIGGRAAVWKEAR